jgi:hypothetical protein
MRNRLNLKSDDLRVESFETERMPGLRGNLATAAHCPSCTCGGATPAVAVDAAATCYCCV